jgi:glyoxalase-like protein
LSSPVKTRFDHLVVAASTLEEGEDHIEALTGARPRPGGQHVAMGTHNSVLRLGQGEYLEVIAIDPRGIVPDRPRWFELDTPAMKKRLAASPQLIHWAVNTVDIEAARRAAAAGIDPGAAYPMERGPFRWKITIPDDGRLPGNGLVPTLIQWAGIQRPANVLEDIGIRVAAIAGAHPNPGEIRAALALLGLTDVMPVTYSDTPRIAAMLHTPRGTVTL